MHPDPARLVRVPLFEGLSDAQREEIASWLDIEEFRAGTSITHEGRSEYAFFVLDEGTVRVIRGGEEIGRLEPGDVFGEGAMLGDGHRNADATAESDVTVFSMFGTHFRVMQGSMPAVAERLQALRSEREAEIGETG